MYGSSEVINKTLGSGERERFASFAEEKEKATAERMKKRRDALASQIKTTLSTPSAENKVVAAEALAPAHKASTFDEFKNKSLEASSDKAAKLVEEAAAQQEAIEEEREKVVSMPDGPKKILKMKVLKAAKMKAEAALLEAEVLQSEANELDKERYGSIEGTGEASSRNMEVKVTIKEQKPVGSILRVPTSSVEDKTSTRRGPPPPPPSPEDKVKAARAEVDKQLGAENAWKRKAQEVMKLKEMASDSIPGASTMEERVRKRLADRRMK